MDSAFYSCVDDTIEDAFDASSDTEPADSDEFDTHLPSRSHLDSEARHVDIDAEDRAAFAVRNCNKDADWSAVSQQQHLSNDDMLQGNFAGNSDGRRLPTVGSLRLSQSSANTKCSLTACDNVPLNSNRSVTDVYHSELSRQRTSRYQENLFVNSSDSNGSRQPLLASAPHMESAKSHFQMSKAALPNSANRVADAMFLPDDKVMEIVEEQLENDDDGEDDVDDDDNDTDVDDNGYVVNMEPVLAVEDDDDDDGNSGDDSDVDEVEEISEDDEDRLADEERAVLQEAARAAAEAAAASSSAAGDCQQHADKTAVCRSDTSADDSVKTTFPQSTSDAPRELLVGI